MTKTVVLMLFGLFCEAFGVVLISKGLKQIGTLASYQFGDLLRIVIAAITNSNFLSGLLLETIFFICLCVLLAKSDVSFLWPLTSLGFVLTAVAAKFFLHEHVSPLRWTGVLLIVLGAGIITWSEKVKPQKVTPPAILEAK
jgi:drug/metabolite transporter (DMT)-like permease